MRAAVGLAGAAFVFVFVLLGAVIMNPFGAEQTSGASSAMVAAIAVANAKEGQGDLTSPCAPDAGGAPGGANEAGAGVAAKAAARAGFTGHDLLVAVAVAGAESGWNPTATHLNDDGSTDYGTWQINSVHAELLAAGDWRDPYSNALMAHRVWADAGSSWTPWTTFTSGAYLTRLTSAAAAIGGADLPDPCGGGPVPGGIPGSGEGGLTPWTVAMRRAVVASFHRPDGSVGCYRTAEDGGEHPRGRACDVMVYEDKATGDQVAQWVQAHAGSLHIKYVIWQQAIWSPARASEGWRGMPDRGGATANHRDHVHVSVLCGPADTTVANAGCPE